jgi:hypothetical protein
MTAPKDPLAFDFDFGLGFKTAPERIAGEKFERRELAARAIPYHVQFLDDILRDILPHDLILLGAETGAGKTELARLISSRSAESGRHVFYFALEAEDREIERRDKFAILCGLMKRDRAPLGGMNYPDWYRGRCDGAIGNLDREADEIIAERRKTLHTYYRGSKFGSEDIKRLFMSIQSQADLIVLDHLHYVDIEDDNENRGFKSTIKMIRDVALGIGKPVIVIAHLRKQDARFRSIVPRMEDFHGSSDIGKIVTHAVLLAPARCVPSTDPDKSNTFMSVPKDRMGGATGLVALCQFDRRFKSYDKTYTLGRANGDKFEPLGASEVPSWALKNHVPLTTPMADVGGVA